MIIFTLAENLHMMVTDIRERMPASELMGWVQYYRQRDEQREQASKGPNMLDNPNLMLKGFGL
jgi:hypothetical protein